MSSSTREIKDLPPCLIHIDEQGHWFHKGAEIIRREYIRDFYKHMVLDAHGKYIITWEGKPCYVEVADTAFAVWQVTFQRQAPGRDVLALSLSDDSEEPLAPDTLQVGKENILYCRVKQGAFPARFCRPAYYKIAAYIEEGPDGFYLPLNGKKYLVKA